jgi:VWFA-related protein
VLTGLKRLIIAFVGGFAIFAASFFLLLATAEQGPRRDIGRNIPLPAVSADGASAVTAEVVVTDADGRPLHGLKKEDFRILIDGNEEQITVFQQLDEPVTLALLVEFGGMFNAAVLGDDRVTVPAEMIARSLQEDDWTGLVGYDIRTSLIVDFTRNRDLIAARIRDHERAILDQQHSAFYDAFAFTIDRMKDVPGTKAIVALSSGLDTGSSKNYADILELAESSETAIYSVGMSEEALLFLEGILEREVMSPSAIPPPYLLNIPTIGQFRQARNTLRSLAEVTGGVAFFPTTRNQYPEVVDTINAHLHYRYRIGFLPTASEKGDDRPRLLKVEVRKPNSVQTSGTIRVHNRKSILR